MAGAQVVAPKAQEVILAGPAETGKTFACCHKMDALLWKYAGAGGAGPQDPPEHERVGPGDVQESPGAGYASEGVWR